MTALPIPPPWRSLLANLRDIETGSDLYARIKAACLNAGARELSGEAVDHWEADQDTGRIRIECGDGTVIRANFELLGTKTGEDFLWADANPSIRNSGEAKRVRDLLAASGAQQLAKPDRLPLGLRDVKAILALASDALSVQNTFLACSRNVVGAMILNDVSISRAEAIKQEPSLLSRLFGAAKAKRKEEEQRSPLHVMQQMIQAQLNRNALTPDRLGDFDAICADVLDDCERGRCDEALKRIASAKRDLGEFFIDQEPAGWLIYTEGACLLEKGELVRANQAFREASRALVPPGANLVRLGMSRSAVKDALRRSSLCALYIGSPSWFADHATREEVQTVRAAQSEADATRAGVADDAEAVLRAALAACFAQEVRAHEWSEEAKSHRNDLHIMRDADTDAHDSIDAEYRALLLTWFDVPRDPSMGSWSSHPGEDPSALQALTATERGEQEAMFTATFKNSHGSIDTYRYKLIRVATPMSARAMWRIAETWSVWPDEDIRLH
jgi:hypothetical protein